MILRLHDLIRTRLRAVLTDLYGLSPDTQPALVIEYPPNRPLGDLALTVAFELARTLRKAPKVIAQEIVTALGEVDGVDCFVESEKFASLERLNHIVENPLIVREAHAVDRCEVRRKYRHENRKFFRGRIGWRCHLHTCAAQGSTA